LQEDFQGSDRNCAAHERIISSKPD
jgi:hypothetical protein